MTARIHFICHDSQHVTKTQFPEFESGYWRVSETDAKRLVGGKLYLHETKREASYFGGDILSYRLVTGPEYHGTIVFTVRSTRDGRGAAWEGKDHDMAWNGEIVED